MKKALSLLLVLVLALSLSTVAFAENGTIGGKAEEYITSVDIPKTYTVTGAAPAETFTFTVSPVSGPVAGVDAPALTASSIAFDGETTTGLKSTISFAGVDFPRVGDYVYTITETAGNTAGVVYDTTTYYLRVRTFQFDEPSDILPVSAIIYKSNVFNADNKLDAVKNEYASGSLAVSKTVTGALGDRSKPFTVTVEFTAPAGKTEPVAISYSGASLTETQTVAKNAEGKYVAVIELTHGQTMNFTNIPSGTTYTVTETTPEGYTATYALDGAAAAGPVSDSILLVEGGDQTLDDTVAITNNKGGTPDTGVSLDSLPYILLLVAAAAGLVLFLGKKRFAGEN